MSTRRFYHGSHQKQGRRELLQSPHLSVPFSAVGRHWSPSTRGDYWSLLSFSVASVSACIYYARTLLEHEAHSLCVGPRLKENWSIIIEACLCAGHVH